MNLQEINQMHVDQQIALSNMITKNDIKHDEMKEDITRQDEDDYANFSNKDNK